MTIASSNSQVRNHSAGTARFARSPLSTSPFSRAPGAGLNEMGLDALNEYVNSSEEAWRAFIDAGVSSNFYYTAREHLEPFDAASITLLKNYLDTFFPGDRAMVDGDPDCFFKYADAFLRELSMPELANAPELPMRHLLLGRVRHLLKEGGDSRFDVDRHFFIAAVLKLCSSLECIIHARDVYKEYMFRIYPQLHVRVA